VGVTRYLRRKGTDRKVGAFFILYFERIVLPLYYGTKDLVLPEADNFILWFTRKALSLYHNNKGDKIWQE
jgi:hypothetical protein